MGSLLEKIAAKKAAEAAAKAIMASVEHKEEQPDGTIVSTASAPIEKIKEVVAEQAEGKPLSFAEKMALKKAQSLSATEGTSSEATVTAPIVQSTEKSSVAIPDEVVIKIVAAVAEEEDHSASIAQASPADQQAYADIKAKLSLLSDMADTDLKSAMTDLKKSLLQNPQACYLMLPQDIGQMVIALRAMKNETVVALTKEPKEKKSKASKPLTADEIAAAFDEL